jgi:DNA-binding response OmpR family regulator
VLDAIRNRLQLKVPVLMLTAKGDVDARVMGLETGADDYMAKPVHMKELQARILAVLRRKEELDRRNGDSMGVA